MPYLKQYVKKIQKHGNSELAESVFQTAEKFGRDHLGERFYEGPEHKIGLLAGNIQSGKTSQVLAMISKAADKGFPVFIFLTADNNALQQQTLNRAREDLDGFCVCNESDQVLFLDNNLVKPTVIVLKKNSRVLHFWRDVLLSCGYLKGNPLFIIDDEADARSLNTLINKGKKSSVYKNLQEIRNDSSRSFYLQVTGTPQALVLQSVQSDLRPDFIQSFEPGEDYLGGDFFFSQQEESEAVHFIEEMENPERQVVLSHLAASALVFADGGKVCNALIHPSSLQKVHEAYKESVEQELKWCRENSEGLLKEELKKVYEHLTPEKSKKAPFEEVYSHVLKLLEEGLQVLVMNDKHPVFYEDYASGSNIIIGGNSLGRGVTFPGLHTIYYTRTSKTPQADTIWQHSRMFGYDRDPGLISLFIDRRLYKLFSDINAANNSLYNQIEAGINSIQIKYPPGIKPTRSNVLDRNKVSIIPGGTNYFPFSPDNDSIEELDELLKPFSQEEPYYNVGVPLIKTLLSHIKSEEDFSTQGFLSDLEAILADNPIEQGVLIVRRNRDIARGTGALLSPNDWKLANSFAGKTVLTMYKVTGEKGWDGRQLWIPNIKLPEGLNFYHVKSGE